MAKKRKNRGTLSTPVPVGSSVSSKPSADRIHAKPSLPATGNKANKWLILASILLFLATTGGLVLFNLTYVEKPKWIGEIKLETQGEYHSFLDAIFTEQVTVNVLDIQPDGVDIPTKRDQLQADYSELPVVLGFDLSATENPLGNLSRVKLYSEFYGGSMGRDYGRLVWSVVLSLLGYPVAIGLWLSRKGIYEDRVTSTSQALV